MKITYFVHSITTDNEKGLATGWLQGELSEEGIKRIKLLPGLIVDNSFEAVYPSDLKRAVQSAEIAFSGSHLIIPDKRLREVNYGDLDGTPKKFKKDMVSFIDSPYPSGESYHDTEKRILDFLEEKKNEGKEHIAIMGHEATQLALEVICNSKTWPEAIREDWRPTQSWKPGWVYNFI